MQTVSWSIYSLLPLERRISSELCGKMSITHHIIMMGGKTNAHKNISKN